MNSTGFPFPLFCFIHRLTKAIFIQQNQPAFICKFRSVDFAYLSLLLHFPWAQINFSGAENTFWKHFTEILCPDEKCFFVFSDY